MTIIWPKVDGSQKVSQIANPTSAYRSTCYSLWMKIFILEIFMSPQRRNEIAMARTQLKQNPHGETKSTLFFSLQLESTNTMQLLNGTGMQVMKTTRSRYLWVTVPLLENTEQVKPQCTCINLSYINIERLNTLYCTSTQPTVHCTVPTVLGFANSEVFFFTFSPILTLQLQLSMDEIQLRDQSVLLSMPMQQQSCVRSQHLPTHWNLWGSR